MKTHSTSIPSATDSESRCARKLRELSVEHGRVVEEFVQAGKLPVKQIDNFYGRHSDRRRAILNGIASGLSYSKAYQASRDCFDTKRWRKVGNRVANCRGLLLKTTAALVAQGLPISWPLDDIDQVKAIAMVLRDETKTLLRELVGVEMVQARKTDRRTFRYTGGTIEAPTASLSVKQVVSRLTTAITKLKKNTRDVPQMTSKLGEPPTVTEVAQIVVEAGRIIHGVPILLAVLDADRLSGNDPFHQQDIWGIGLEYARWLDRVPDSKRSSTLATHKSPDADAMVATWITDRFLFPDEPCRVDFVPRDFTPQDNMMYDAVLDVGRMHDPDRLIFDHKPPAFDHRDEHCATSLVWDHAIGIGCQVDGLRELVELVHDGDAATRRQRSQVYAGSRSNGLHALITSARLYAQSDRMLYQGIAGYLDACLRGEGGFGSGVVGHIASTK